MIEIENDLLEINRYVRIELQRTKLNEVKLPNNNNELRIELYRYPTQNDLKFKYLAYALESRMIYTCQSILRHYHVRQRVWH